jgi:hypothetical protein
MPEPTPAPIPCERCRRAGKPEPHWRCVWCSTHGVRPSEWEQLVLGKGEWATLCQRCAAKRLRNPFNALINFRKRGEES